MTVQEFYEEVGGDYNDIMSRLRTEERIKICGDVHEG